LRLRLDLAVGGDRRRHVEDDRGLLTGGYRDRDRVRRKEHLQPTPRRQVIGAADGVIQADHVVLERHARVKRRRARVVAPLRTDPGNAGVLRFVDRDRGGAPHDEVAHAVVAVNHRHRGRLALDANRRPHVDRPALDTADVLREAEHPVAFGAVHVGPRHELGDVLCVSPRNADGFERARDECFKVGGLNAFDFCHTSTERWVRVKDRR
jgi:hypothetical protein